MRPCEGADPVKAELTYAGADVHGSIPTHNTVSRLCAQLYPSSAAPEHYHMLVVCTPDASSDLGSARQNIREVATIRTLSMFCLFYPCLRKRRGMYSVHLFCLHCRTAKHDTVVLNLQFVLFASDCF